MANSNDRGTAGTSPKGGPANKAEERMTPEGHAQRRGEGADADDQLRDAGQGGGARTDADRNVADVDRDGSGGATGTRQQGGGAESEGMG